jgi:Carboxypeptidase regulatory-like domain/TonB dependent receptor
MRKSLRRARFVSAVFLLVAPFFTTRPLAAQSVYGMVWGRLTAVAGTPVSGALVTVTAAQTEARNKAWTDAGGYFTISNLTPDLYQVEVQADGFKRVQGTVAVSADSTATVNSTLQPGDPNVGAASTAASASALKLDRTDVSTQFDLRSVEDLPLLDLNVTRLQLLVPGAAAGKLFIPSSENPQNGTPVNVNGQHFSGSAFQLDGTESRDPLEGIVVINPTLDSVGEMKITTQGYNAEFGQSTAGVVTIQTRTGSNAWHGDGFGFRRTGFGQTQDPFSPPGIAPTKYNIFGGSIGGPIARNRLFVFGDYQGTRSSQGTNLLLSVPSQNVLNTCLGATKGAPANCDLSDYSKFIAGTLTDNEGNPFPGNQIPNFPNKVSPDHFVSNQAAAVLALLASHPPNHLPTDSTCAVSNLANSVCNNYLVSGQNVFSADQFDVRSDYYASSRLRLFGRYSFGEFSETGAPAFGPQAGGLGINPSGFAGIALTRNQGISSGFTYTLGPKLLTDFRFGYFRYRLNINAQDYGQTPAIGIPNIFAADTGDPFATGLPDFEIPGQGGLVSGGTADYLRLGYSNVANSCACPLREREQQFQFVNNWIRSSGHHIIKWGADLRYLQNYRFESVRPPTGYFDFAPGTTGMLPGAPGSGLGLATFLIGDVTSGFERSFSSPSSGGAGEHQKRFGFYGQDTWRINSRFTLNYGLRWEIYFPQTVTGAGGFLVPNLSNPNPATTYFNGPPAGGISGNLTNFAPRLGIAYLINPTTVIRAGYGRSFDAGYAGDIFGIAATQNPPVTVNQSVQNFFNLAQGPPLFTFPSGHFSLLDLAAANIGSPNVTPTIPASGATLYALPSRVRVPTVDSWNLTLQHEFTPHLYFELGYVGDKGKDVFPDNKTGTYYDLNQASLQGLIAPVQGGDISNCKANAIFPSKTNPQFCLTQTGLRSFYNQVEIPNDPCQPKKCYFSPNLFNVFYFGNNANDNYNSLQAKVHKSFSRGYSMMAHYTWSKGLDYEDNYFRVDPREGYGPDSFDIRHRFVMTNIWDLPIGRGKAWLGGIGPAADRFLGGWTISAITIWRSGIPFSPTYTATNCGRDTDPGDPCRPNLVGTVHVSGSRTQYFSTTGGQALAGNDCVANNRFCGVDANGKSAVGKTIGPWQRPGAGQIGTAGRDSLYGPGFFQSDIGLAKVIPVTEGVALRFRADAFNAFNKVNLGQPNACVDCPNGGSIKALAFGAVQRTLQFSLRIEF